MANDCSLDDVQRALDCIPCDIDRETWVKVLAAVYAGLGDAGMDVVQAWSEGAATYNAADFASAWRSVRKPGGVTVASLFYVAKDYGYKPAKRGQQATQKLAPNATQRQQEQARVQAEIARQQDAAAALAVQQWDAATTLPEDATHGYLQRKGVRAHGLRQQGTLLLVDMRTAAGVLRNVQTIAADGSKRFLKGGQKGGTLHWLGTPDGAEAVLLAEGYATAASLHQHAGLPVAVCFDAGNLVHVAKAVRHAMPGMPIVVCGDDDGNAPQHKAKSRNPGKEKALQAAKTAGAVVAMPEGLTETQSDFNDLAQTTQGVQALFDTVQRAVAEAQALMADIGQVQDAQTHGADDGGLDGGDAGDANSEDASAEKPEGFIDPFVVKPSGIYHRARDRDGTLGKEKWICAYIEVEAITRDFDNANFGRLLRWRDMLGNDQQWAMPARLLAGDGAAYRTVLLDRGWRMASSTAAKSLVAQFLETRKPDRVAYSTDKVGWHQGAFVLPNGQTVGAEKGSGQDVIYQPEAPTTSHVQAKGTLQQWQQQVAAPCAGLSRPVFAISCALAAPLLRLVGINSGGFHLYGDSSSGKSTMQLVAASVWGGHRYKQSWKFTSAGLEIVAAAHNDMLLVLDEIKEIDPRILTTTIYMLGNGQGSGRGNQGMTMRRTLEWRLLFLSTGEITKQDAVGGVRTYAGEEMRMTEIRADAGSGHGVYEHVPQGFDDGAALSQHLFDVTQNQHGTAGLAWLRYLTEQGGKRIQQQMQQGMDGLLRQWLPSGAHGQVSRLARRMALVAMAGELASTAGITGWQTGDAERAAKTCFDSWVHDRGGWGAMEDGQILAQMRDLLSRSREGKFIKYHRAHDDHAPRTVDIWGYCRWIDVRTGEPFENTRAVNMERQLAGDTGITADQKTYNAHFWDNVEEDRASLRYEYYVMPEAFERIVCQGFNVQAVCKLLQGMGHLAGEKNGQYTKAKCRMRIPGMGMVAVYRIKHTLFEEAEPEAAT